MPSMEPTIQKPGPALRPGGNRLGDKIFGSIAVAAGATIIGAIALMGLFLLIRAVPSLGANHTNFITSSEFVTYRRGQHAVRHRRSVPGHAC